MIMGEIKRFLRDDGIIKVSRSIKTAAKKLHYDKEKLCKELNREPTIEELSQFSGYTVDEILMATESSSSPNIYMMLYIKMMEHQFCLLIK